MNVLESIQRNLEFEGFTFERKDLDRPWGGFWAISQPCKKKFIKKYFPEYQVVIEEGLSLSPKILAVAPNRNLGTH